jgi:hypothetical protein
MSDIDRAEALAHFDEVGEPVHVGAVETGYEEGLGRRLERFVRMKDRRNFAYPHSLDRIVRRSIHLRASVILAMGLPRARV